MELIQLLRQVQKMPHCDLPMATVSETDFLRLQGGQGRILLKSGAQLDVDELEIAERYDFKFQWPNEVPTEMRDTVQRALYDITPTGWAQTSWVTQLSNKQGPLFRNLGDGRYDEFASYATAVYDRVDTERDRQIGYGNSIKEFLEQHGSPDAGIVRVLKKGPYSLPNGMQDCEFVLFVKKAH